MKKGSFVSGLFIGSLVGAALGVLFAPQAGSETREWLMRAKKEHQDLIDETRDAADKLIQKTKQSIEESMEKLSKSLENRDSEMLRAEGLREEKNEEL